MEISKTPTMQIKGDFTDLHQEWKDQLHKLMRIHNVKEFIIVADVSAAPVFSANDTIKDKQERNLNSFFNELVNMASTEELRTRVRAIEILDIITESQITPLGAMVNVDFDTSNTTFKSRYLAHVYGDICKPNDIKDSIMLNNITKIRFDSTSLNIREEVSSKISLYEKYDSELQDSQKQPVAQKKRFFAKIFTNIPQVSTAIMALQLHHSAASWEHFKTTILRACQTVMEMNSSHEISAALPTVEPSSNSTAATSTPNQLTFTLNETQLRSLVERVSRGKRSQSRSPARTTSPYSSRPNSPYSRQSPAKQHRGRERTRGGNNYARSRSPQRSVNSTNMYSSSSNVPNFDEDAFEKELIALHYENEEVSADNYFSR